MPCNTDDSLPCLRPLVSLRLSPSLYHSHRVLYIKFNFSACRGIKLSTRNCCVVGVSLSEKRRKKLIDRVKNFCLSLLSYIKYLKNFISILFLSSRNFQSGSLFYIEIVQSNRTERKWLEQKIDVPLCLIKIILIL